MIRGSNLAVATHFHLQRSESAFTTDTPRRAARRRPCTACRTSAGVQLRQNDLRAAPLHLRALDGMPRPSSSTVTLESIWIQTAMRVHSPAGFVDRVVHHFEHEMMETSLARVAEYMPGACERPRAFEHLMCSAPYTDTVSGVLNHLRKTVCWSSDSIR